MDNPLLELGIDPQPWVRDAACVGADYNDFFYEERFPPHSAQQSRHIKWVQEKYCNNCPVRQECLDYALNNNEPCGIWGGLSPSGRGKYRARRNRGTV